MNNAVDEYIKAKQDKEQIEEMRINRINQLKEDLSHVLKAPQGQRVFKYIFSLFREGQGAGLSAQELYYNQGQRDLINTIKSQLTIHQLRAIEDLK